MDETDDMSTLKEKFGKLGLFKLEMWREQQLYQVDSTSIFEADAPKPIPEKALKGQPLEVTTTFVPALSNGPY
jgi:hypothetical protein